jgi:hypothetical protein
LKENSVKNVDRAKLKENSVNVNRRKQTEHSVLFIHVNSAYGN